MNRWEANENGFLDPSIRTSYWSLSAESLTESLQTRWDGLTDGRASERRGELCANHAIFTVPIGVLHPAES